MKAVKLFFGAMALAVVSMVAAPAASAQENGNRGFRRRQLLVKGQSG